MKIQCSESLKELDIKLLWLGFLGDSKKWQKVCRKNVLKNWLHSDSDQGHKKII